MIDQPLPIEPHLPALAEALRAHRNAVLVAPPGAGKTTRVPLALLGEGWAAEGRIILLEPRRLAARAAAERMAATLGAKVGGVVGLRTRLDTRIGPDTRIEVVTEGVFTRLILDDPALGGIEAVILDEFHERSLDADFSLALALDAQAGLREDLRLLVMSATLDGARVAKLMGDAPVIESAGRAFPVETRYLGRDPALRLDAAMARALERAIRVEAGGILAFLPGQGEIARVKALLEAARPGEAGLDILPLHGGLDVAEQDRAVRASPRGRRKIVLATAIAETSVTIADIRVVVDSGVARVPVYEPDVGVTRLETVRVSRAAADQRRGRAGRTAPGLCLRLWDEAQTRALPAFATPEILNADLSGLLLDCAAWGIDTPLKLPFLDPPPDGALSEARRLLAELGALDGDGRLTDIGRAIRGLPLPPRLARMLLDAARLGAADMAASLAAVVVERGLGGAGVDIAERLDNLARERSPRAQAMRRLASGWARAAERLAEPAEAGAAARPPPLGILVALAYPDRIAKARGGGEFLLANGRAARLDAVDRLAACQYLAVAEMAGRAAGARIQLAAGLDAAEIEAWFSDRVDTRDTTSFDTTAQALRRRRQRRLGALVLDSAPLPVVGDEEAALALARGIAAIGLDKLPWTAELARWRGRVEFLRKAAGPGGQWPDVSDAALTAGIDEWLAPGLLGKTSLADVSLAELRAALEGLLPFHSRRELDIQAPSHFDAPSGSRLPIDYGEEGASLAVRVQELFGLAEHPRIAGGRVPLVLHLQSPAHRPVQVTADLPGFWRGSWSEVRAQLRGRYPRHPWPEDPLAEPPTRRAKPRKA